jgi:hypothetical protein
MSGKSLDHSVSNMCFLHNYLCIQLNASRGAFDSHNAGIVEPGGWRNEGMSENNLDHIQMSIKMFPQRLRTLEKTLKNAVLGRKGVAMAAQVHLKRKLQDVCNSKNIQ